MEFEFEKYHGTGNDFILINDNSKKFPIKDSDRIRLLCDRKFGIGSDGLVIIRDHKEFDFEMLYFNADGVEGSLCGNGSRCAVAYGIDNGLLSNKVVFKAVDGIHYASAESSEMFSLSFKNLKRIDQNSKSLFLDTGSPHHVQVVTDIENIDIKEKGSFIRYGSKYKEEGVNVSFVEKIGSNLFKLRTYERGVEDETLSCGTGAVAASLAVHYLKLTDANEVSMETLGGILKVKFRLDFGTYKDTRLIGPAKKVFSGKIEW